MFESIFFKNIGDIADWWCGYRAGKSVQAYCVYCVLPYEKKRLSTELYMGESMQEGGDQALN